MAVSQSEAIASLKLLVCMAKADGSLAPEERAVLEEMLGHKELSSALTTQQLLGEDHDVDKLIAEVTSREARDAAYQACHLMAHADRQCLPQEQALLDRLEKDWGVSMPSGGVLGRIFQEARDTVSFTSIEPVFDPEKRRAEINEDVLKYSILAAVLGANPIPIASLVTDIAVVGLQAKMFRDIGLYHGHRTSSDAVKQVLGAVGIGTGVRLAVNGLVKFIPGVGSVVAASTNFASTWALGKVASEFYEMEGGADMKRLTAVFDMSVAEGKKTYREHSATVTAKTRAHGDVLQKAATEYHSGKISRADYEKQVDVLK